MNPMTPLLQVNNLVVRYPSRRSATTNVAAVDHVTFTLERGECLGIVGESGSGKSTLARAILQLLRASEGSIHFDGIELTELWGSSRLRSLRPRMQMIFQDPYASLDPRMTVAQIIGEGLAIHSKESKTRQQARVEEVLSQVGLDPSHLHRFPHEFSGGQRQRIGIARALILKPDLIVADEPISALDVSIQAQILKLLWDLKQSLGLTYIFIGHDLAAVHSIADRIAVMSKGRIVEFGTADDICFRPQHPYTQQLLASVPRF